MKIQFMSDVHINKSKPGPIGPHPEADVCVFLGDMCEGPDGFTWIKENFPNKRCIYIFGNHEPYYGDLFHLMASIKEAAKGTQITVLDNETIVIDGVSFFGGTLWTDMKYKNVQEPIIDPAIGNLIINQSVRDYNHIKYDGARMNGTLWAYLHNECIVALKKFLKENNPEKSVVCTHHLPFPQSISTWYQSAKNTAFVSDLRYLLDIGQPKYWLHGHSHDPVKYKIADTNVLSNPAGYNRGFGFENHKFDPMMMIEI